MKTLNIPTTRTALDAFMARKAQIDAALKDLQTISDDHFETNPDAINWADVGTITEIAKRLDSALAFAREYIGAEG